MPRTGGAPDATTVPSTPLERLSFPALRSAAQIRCTAVQFILDVVLPRPAQSVNQTVSGLSVHHGESHFFAVVRPESLLTDQNPASSQESSVLWKSAERWMLELTTSKVSFSDQVDDFGPDVDGEPSMCRKMIHLQRHFNNSVGLNDVDRKQKLLTCVICANSWHIT